MEVEMNLIDLLAYISDEEKAEKYLREIKTLYTYEKCIYCSSSLLGYVRRGKIKCYKCKREWSRRKGSIVNKCRISFSKIILVLKLFAMDIPQVTISKELGVSRNAIGQLIEDIRNEIFKDEIGKMDQELSGSKFYQGGKIILYISDSIIKITSADSKNINVDECKHLCVNILRKKNNNFEYYYIFNAQLVGKAQDTIRQNQIISKWSELKKDLIKYKGRNRNNMLIFLFEVIFRNNNKDQIYQKIINEIRVADNQQTRKIIDKKVRF
jgi:transposase